MTIIRGVENMHHHHINGVNGSHNHDVNGTSQSCLEASSDVNPSLLPEYDRGELLDVVGVGFGPTNLALAIAMNDTWEAGVPVSGGQSARSRPPKALFLERQKQFSWHQGMLLPGTRMQISFLKDMATLRNPRSHFTFLNYLHEKQRLVPFTNLSTFLPQRNEYQDYMSWCAEHFNHIVRYRQEVQSISPISTNLQSGEPVSAFRVTVRDIKTGETDSFQARHVVIGAGGRANIPKTLASPGNSCVIHSSRYKTDIGSILRDPDQFYHVAVIGGGQSGAEIFNDLHSRYPNARTKLIMRASALKPSDDSPFVNEIFDPARIDKFYCKSATERAQAIQADLSTNYSVVQANLLEHLYAEQYAQRVNCADEERWQHRILANESIVHAQSTADGAVTLTLRSGQQHTFDAVICATGYLRDMHEELLRASRGLMPGQGADENGRWTIGRNYRVNFAPGTVSDNAGVWLQGCNEGTHGLSDTLLSVVATRASEMVSSLFE